MKTAEEVQQGKTFATAGVQAMPTTPRSTTGARSSISAREDQVAGLAAERAEVVGEAEEQGPLAAGVPSSSRNHGERIPRARRRRLAGMSLRRSSSPTDSVSVGATTAGAQRAGRAVWRNDTIESFRELTAWAVFAPRAVHA